ncbi:hypothetical protein, partial [Aeromonas hydrophila]
FKITSTHFDFYRAGILLRDEFESLHREIKRLQNQLKLKSTASKTSPIEVEFSPPEMLHHKDKKSLKIQKLKRKPILFFRDAFKNLYQSSNSRNGRA